MSLESFVVLNLAIYLPFHLFEEAIGDFPKWMYEHKWLPYHMTHGHWMANNLFLYYPMLLISAFLFMISEHFLCFGVGILIWGLINFGDHFFYTIKDRKRSPGLYSGVLFLINSMLGIRCLMLSQTFSLFPVVLGVIIGGILFGMPIALCVIVYPVFDKYFR